jgi:CTP synthase
MFSNVPMKRIFSMHDRPSIYTIPDEMRRDGLDREILSVLNLHERVDVAHEDRSRDRWAKFVRKLTSPHPRTLNLGITGKYAHLRDAYASIDKAIEHCGAHLDTTVKVHWMDTTELSESTAHGQLGSLDAVIVPGGFGSRGVEGKIAAVRVCREHKIPFLGICLGFQVAVIEYARNVLGLPDANSTEFDPRCQNPLISELPDQKRLEGLGGTMRLGAQDVLLTEKSLASYLYNRRLSVRERFRHRYEVDPQYIGRLEAGGLIFSGRHPTQPIMQVLELPSEQSGAPNGHPYFMAAQFHPELTSRPLRPQPLFMGLIAAAIYRTYGTTDAQRAELANDPILSKWLRPPAEAMREGKPSTKVN